MTENIVTCQLNVNGLSGPSFTSLQKFMYQRDISILALQETKLSESPADSFTNMLTFHNFSNLGVSLSIATSLKPQEISSLNCSTDGISTVWAMVNINSKPLLISSVYCPPSTTNSENIKIVIDNIRNAEQYARKYNIKSLLLLGDFNSRHTTWGDTLLNPRGRILHDFVDNQSGCTLFSPSCKTFVVAGGGGSVIDLALGLGPICQLLSQPWIDRKDVHELFTGAPLRGHFPVLQNIICPNPKV